MSNYICKAKNKTTGIVVEVLAIDDYFGKHKYGYKVGNSQNVLNEILFDENYEIIKDNE